MRLLDILRDYFCLSEEQKKFKKHLLGEKK